MSLSSYQILNTVIEQKSLARAAQILSITPSAVSHSLNALEREFGFPLLRRDRSGIALTENGEALLKYMQMVLADEELLREEVALINGLEKWTVKIGTFNSVCSSWIPDILGAFCKKHPLIKVKVFQGIYGEIASLLENGELDLGFLALPVSDKLESFLLARDRMVCITPLDFEPASPGVVTRDDIKDECFIMQREGDDTDQRALLDKYRLDVQRQHDLIDDLAIVALVEAGLGISITPELVLEKLPGRYQIFPFQPEEFRSIALVKQKKRPLSPAAKRMADEIRSYVRGRFPDGRVSFKK